MAAAIRAGLTRKELRWPFIVITVAAVSITLLVLLVGAVMRDPTPSVDLTVMAWVTGWDLPGLAGFFAVMNFLTTSWPAPVVGVMVIGLLWLIGKGREASGLAVIGGSVGLLAFLGASLLASLVGRSGPLLGSSGYSFPSGHVFGTTVLFGFVGFLAIYLGLKKRYQYPLLALCGGIIFSAAPSKMYTQAHWPSDVAAGYLLGALWLAAVIPVFLHLRRSGWFSLRSRKVVKVEGCEPCRVEGSIASVVMIDPEKGTATKVYRPPALLRIMYWLAFQARFPYENNLAALRVAGYRRKIAGLLTAYRLGKNLVSPVIAVGTEGARHSLVTEFVPGETVQKDQATLAFLGQVTEIFSEAGMPVWQVNPRNPHSHTNVIRTAEGDLKIIDLESAVVTLPPTGSHWRSSLHTGNFPVFDDIDFQLLRGFVEAKRSDIQDRLGVEGLAEMEDAVERCERASRAWTQSESRLLSRLTRWAYRLVGGTRPAAQPMP